MPTASSAEPDSSAASAERRAPAPKVMHCMEIIGGNEAIDDAVSAPGIDVFVRSTPHKGDAQGGDVYYLSLCGSGRVARVVIADVSGHGEAVAEVATALRGLMRKSIGTPNQTRLARALNREFASEVSGGRFATAVMTTYYAPTDQLIVCNAGHPPPLWWSASAGEWLPLQSDAPRVIRTGRGPRNLPLGIIEPTEYVQFAVQLGPGDLALLYTDAIIEARRAGDDQLLGAKGLHEIVRTLSAQTPENLLDRLQRELASRGYSPPDDDDATLILIHHNASNPPPLSIGDTLRVTAKMLGLSRV